MPLDKGYVERKVRDTSYAGRLKRLEAFVDELEKRIDEKDAQIKALSQELTVCQNNCYLLYLENEKRKKEDQLVTWGYDKDLQNEIDNLACDIADEKRRQEEVRIITGENPTWGWGANNG